MIERALADPVQVEQLLTIEELAELQAATRQIYVDPAVSRYASGDRAARRATLAAAGLAELARYVDYGASPRGPINLVVGARALALLRGRRYVLPQDVRELAKDVLRHRLVLSYEALRRRDRRRPDPRPRSRRRRRCRSSTSSREAVA